MHQAPGNAFYNLSGADSIALSYTVNKAASVKNEVHLRLILKDVHDCVENCTRESNMEVFYSFNHILDRQSHPETSDTKVIPLVGERNGT